MRPRIKTTCLDGWNLPPGLAPSGIPGNSRKEIAVERAMEKAEELVDGFLDDLYGVKWTLHDAFDDGAEEAQLVLLAVSNTLESIQVKLDDARNILGRVLE